MHQSISTLFVGLKGSGKSTIGNAWALQLTIPFVDVDHRLLDIARVQGHESSSVAELVTRHGVRQFHYYQLRALREIGRTLRSTSMVVSAGGGLLAQYGTRKEVRALLKERRVCILYLKRDPEWLYQSYLKDNLPTFLASHNNPHQRWHKIAAHRMRQYQRYANLTIDLGELELPTHLDKALAQVNAATTYQ